MNQEHVVGQPSQEFMDCIKQHNGDIRRRIDREQKRNEDMNALALKARSLSVLMRDAFLYRTETGSGPATLEPDMVEALTEAFYNLNDITDQMCRMV